MVDDIIRVALHGGATHAINGVVFQMAHRRMEQEFGLNLNELVYLQPYGIRVTPEPAFFRNENDDRFRPFFKNWSWLLDMGVIDKASRGNYVVCILSK